jgi:hypothetical protein
MRNISVLCLFILSSVIGRAEDLVTTEDFNAMTGAGTIAYSSANTVGTTDFVTYTCSGKSAEFGVYKGVICLCLPKNGSTVTTSLISNFKHLQFNYFPDSKNYLTPPSTTMRISISEDGSSWTDITASAIGINGLVNVDMPTPGSYYLKIQNTNGTKPFYISQIQYTTESCNCFKVR